MDDPGDEIGEGAPSREGPRDWHQTGPPPTTIYQGLCRLLQPKHSFNWNGPWNFTRVRCALQSKRSERISQEFCTTLLLLVYFPSDWMSHQKEGLGWVVLVRNWVIRQGLSITDICSNDFVLDDVVVLTGSKICSRILFSSFSIFLFASDGWKTLSAVGELQPNCELSFWQPSSWERLDGCDPGLHERAATSSA